MQLTDGLYLGVDVGTSQLKAVLLDERGHTVDEASASYPVRTPQPGWTEQDPEAWWAALREAVTVLWSRGRSGRDVAAIGLTGQMHSLVVLDDGGAVLCPAILWSDQRTAAECVEMTETIGAERLLARTGNVALTGFTAPKILWVRRHWPAAYARARHLLLAKDFIRYRLTGTLATDVSDASGTLLLDVRARRWAEDIIGDLGIDLDLLPRTVEGDTATGAVHARAADLLGLREGTPVVGGGGDNAAAAVGLAAVDPGVLTLSIGTSGVIFAPLDHYPDRVDGRLHVFCHALPGRWHLMSVTLAAGGSLHWLRDALSPVLPAAGDAAYEWLMERAAAAPPGSDGVIFLPYLSGERTPYADPAARGVFFGLHLATSLDHLIRAVLEGVAFSQRQGLDLMREAGAPTAVARGAGGGLSSPVWRQILADALGVGLQLAGPTMGAARGAAILAGLGTGGYSSPEVGVDWAAQQVQRPQPNGWAALDAAFRSYSSLYAQLRPVFASSARADVRGS
jgi:xylulokinase